MFFMQWNDAAPSEQWTEKHLNNVAWTLFHKKFDELTEEQKEEVYVFLFESER